MSNMADGHFSDFWVDTSNPRQAALLQIKRVDRELMLSCESLIVNTLNQVLNELLLKMPKYCQHTVFSRANALHC
jgi:hypothetical protein